jgi:triosephosphate isomerase (TIM)
MSAQIHSPFFEIGPKNYLRRAEIERLAMAAGRAGAEFGVSVVITVPTALIAPISDLNSGVLVFAQGVDADPLGASMARVTVESLVDAGADGVMLNHDSNPLSFEQLEQAMLRMGEAGLASIICAESESDAVRFAALSPSAVLFEPPELIGTAGAVTRDWIPGSTAAIHGGGDGVLAMHAGGVSTPSLARAIMAAGGDGTGSTSGVIASADPLATARDFIAATREGWDQAR